MNKIVKICAQGKDFTQLCAAVKSSGGDVDVSSVMGQRYVGSGSADKRIVLRGTAGNATGAYLQSGEIVVHGNAQEALGDTMNGGRIVVHGSAGDALGYAMRGGSIFIRDNTGFRAGIHLKQYNDAVPRIVVGGSAGDFLGEYQAGGVIAVLGIGAKECCVGEYCATGMHGGVMFIRGEFALPATLFNGVAASVMTKEDEKVLYPLIDEYCALFSYNAARLKDGNYTVLRPVADNPYKQLYVNRSF